MPSHPAEIILSLPIVFDAIATVDICSHSGSLCEPDVLLVCCYHIIPFSPYRIALSHI